MRPAQVVRHPQPSPTAIVEQENSHGTRHRQIVQPREGLRLHHPRRRRPRRLRPLLGDPGRRLPLVGRKPKGQLHRHPRQQGPPGHRRHPPLNSSVYPGTLDEPRRGTPAGTVAAATTRLELRLRLSRRSRLSGLRTTHRQDAGLLDLRPGRRCGRVPGGDRGAARPDQPGVAV